jgi:hypothetical protein
MNYIRKLFGLQNKELPYSNTNELDIYFTKNEINKKQSHCSYCNDTSHKINTCQLATDILMSITEKLSNNNDIPFARTYLQKIDKKLIKRYVTKHHLDTYMYRNCYNYYYDCIDTAEDKNIELIIGYLCVLPFHPELKTKNNKTECKIAPTESSSMYVNINTPGVDIGFYNGRLVYTNINTPGMGMGMGMGIW